MNTPEKKILPILFFLLALLYIPQNLTAAEKEKWQPLFDGQTLNGWTVLGGFADFHVENGTIVGTTVDGSPNSFLCTTRDYGDFILEFEVKCDVQLNSGVQIRSHSYPKNTNVIIWRDGKKIVRQHKAGEVYGCQVDISATQRRSSGAIWDEARKEMWLAEIKNPLARYAYRSNAWNKFRIECRGDSIKTFVNGIPCVDLVDTSDMSGFIGLQVHSVPKGIKAQVRWRNLRIIDLGRHVWKPIFDGFTLDGWHLIPGGKWTVKDGMLIGSSPKKEARHGLLVTDKIYSDFTARVVYKAVKGNSGLYFRVDESGDAVGVHGLQAEIDATKDAGGLYETAGRAWVVHPTPENVKTWFKPGDWNIMTVSARGRNVTVQVNGYTSAEVKNDPGRTKGRLALQLHAGMDMEIIFKTVEILVPARERNPFNGRNLEGWIAKPGGGTSKWTVGIAQVAKDNPKMLVARKGTGELINLATHHGDSLDLYSKDKFGSCLIELEVMVPKDSNSGIYVMGEYEVQVLDSFGKTKMTGGDMGAIYGAAPPKENASKAPGAWQKYIIKWQAPKFAADGRKLTNAIFRKVELNGIILHKNLIMPGPTPGGVDGREKPKGPLMFQGNHGPVAYRNIRIFEWD